MYENLCFSGRHQLRSNTHLTSGCCSSFTDINCLLCGFDETVSSKRLEGAFGIQEAVIAQRACQGRNYEFHLIYNIVRLCILTHYFPPKPSTALFLLF